MPKRYLSYIFLSALLLIFTYNHLQFSFSDTRGYLDIHEVGYLTNIDNISNDLISLKSLNLTKLSFALALKIFSKSYTIFRLLMLIFFLFFINTFYKYIYKTTKSLYVAQGAIFFLLSMPGIIIYSRNVWPQMYSAIFLLLGIMRTNQKHLLCKNNLLAFCFFILAIGFHYSAILYIFIFMIYCKMFTSDKNFKKLTLLASSVIFLTVIILLKANYNHTTLNVFHYLFLNTQRTNSINLENFYNAYTVFFLNKYQMFTFLSLTAFSLISYALINKKQNILFSLFFIITYILLISQPVNAKIFSFIIILTLCVITLLKINLKFINILLYIVLGVSALCVNTVPRKIGILPISFETNAKLYGLILQKDDFGLDKFSDFLESINAVNTKIGLLHLDYYKPNTNIISDLDVFLLKPDNSRLSADHVAFHNTIFTQKGYPVKVEKGFINFNTFHYFILDKFENKSNQSPLLEKVLSLLLESDQMILEDTINSTNKKTYIFKNANKI